MSARTQAAPVAPKPDKSLVEPVVVAPKRKPVSTVYIPGYFSFQCYLGHMTYAEKKAAHIQCLSCNARANPLKETAICLCSHPKGNHSPHCLICGSMQSGDSANGVEHRCEAYSASA